VCRASYIDPRVIERYRTGETIAPTLARLGRRDRQAPKTRVRLERAVIRLLE
jgi:DNA topoisomerase I